MLISQYIVSNLITIRYWAAFQYKSEFLFNKKRANKMLERLISKFEAKNNVDIVYDYLDILQRHK